MDAITKQFSEMVAVQMNSWSAIELRVHEDRDFRTSDLADANGSYRRCEYRYIETALGQRYWQFIGVRADGQQRRLESYCDGEQCANVVFDDSDSNKQAGVYIMKTFGTEDTSPVTDRPTPFSRFFVGKLPMHEALNKSSCEGRANVCGRNCTLFLIRNVRIASFPSDVRIALDDATGVPLQYSSVSPDGKPIWEWTAEVLEKRSSYLMPIVSTYVRYDGIGGILMKSKFTVTTLDYNHRYLPTVFWPRIQANVLVSDSIRKTVINPPTPKKGPAVASVAVPRPVRVSDQPDVLSLNSAVVAASVVLVSIGGLLWYKARR